MTDLQRSDLVLSLDGMSNEFGVVGYFVNGTTLSTYIFGPSIADTVNLIPPAAISFPRLSGLVSTNGSVPLYLYYQLNGTAFEELKYDTAAGIWSSNAVDVVRLINQTSG